MTTMDTAPTTVPIIRNDALRNEAPRTGLHTSAAVVAAHDGLLSSSAKATQRARHTDAHILRPNRMAGVLTLNGSPRDAPPDLLIEEPTESTARLVFAPTRQPRPRRRGRLRPRRRYTA